MSEDNEAEEMMLCCASCGTADGDDINLKDCSACHLVKYCSMKCQKDHWPKHKKECKKRAAELHDEILFKQPESTYRGDCPICCLPLSLDPDKSTLNTCCCKIICNGCNVANMMREMDGRLHHKCPFCREDLPTDEEIDELLMKRIKVNDPVAMCFMGTKRFHEGDLKAAFEYWTRAVALGNVEAHFQLSTLYGEGIGVEKDETRERHHAELAAIGGHPGARHNLGCVEKENGRIERAAKHWIISAKLGDDESLKSVKSLYKIQYISKDVFATALRGYQTAIEATKSPQREEAAEVYKNYSSMRGDA